ncbi:MAG: periplasmic heavy metal sensor [candidate division NC10 bacterium]|nr:periplasmic heavy metal sensor [candidate division NC10 bacterium]
MRAIVTAVLVLLGVVGSVLPPMWTRVALAQEESADPEMMGYRMIPDMMGEMHEMMQGMGMTGPWFYGRGGHKGPLISLMLMWKDQLGLSVDQERSLRELRGSFEKESIKRTAEIDVAELELKGLLEADKVDIAKVEALAKKTAMLRADLRVARIKIIEAGKAVLTPEQHEKFKRLARESMMGDREMRMMGPGMPPMHPGAR